MDRIDLGIVLIAVGLLGIGSGVWTRLGKNRAWYLVPDYPVLLPKGMHYAMPIAGLMTIVIGISLLMPTPKAGRLVFFGVAVPLMITVYLVVIFQPRWLKPHWVRWLEEEHGDILPLLIAEARQTPGWAKRVRTQAGLEAWVAEVRRKYKGMRYV